MLAEVATVGIGSRTGTSACPLVSECAAGIHRSGHDTNSQKTVQILTECSVSIPCVALLLGSTKKGNTRDGGLPRRCTSPQDLSLGGGEQKTITQMINGGTARRDMEGCSQEKDKWGGVGFHFCCI